MKLSKTRKYQTVKIDTLELMSKEDQSIFKMLGFLPGTKAIIERPSFFAGPLVLNIRGSKIAIRKKQADLIQVS